MMPLGIRCSAVLTPLMTSDVAGVVATLEAHHAAGGLGQPVDQLALALVAPLLPTTTTLRPGWA